MNGIITLLRSLLIFIMLGLSLSVKAADFNYTFDLNTFYYSDSFKYTTTNTTTRTFYSASLNLALDKAKTFMVGWGILGYTAPDTSGTTTSTYTASDMGLRLQYNMGKNNTGILAVTYNLQASTKYNPGTEEVLRGTSILVELGVTPDVSEYMNVGFKLMYYAPTFKESLVNTTTYSTVAYTRASIFPAVSVAWRF